MTDARTYYAKVEDGIVTSVHVVAWDFLVANPDRYGDPELWLKCFVDGLGRGYCGIGWGYDSDTDTFTPPPTPPPLPIPPESETSNETV